RMLSQVAELDTDGRFRKSGQQQILIELLLLRFAYLDRTVSIEEVLDALSEGTGPARVERAGTARRRADPPVPSRTSPEVAAVPEAPTTSHPPSPSSEVGKDVAPAREAAPSATPEPSERSVTEAPPAPVAPPAGRRAADDPSSSSGTSAEPLDLQGVRRALRAVIDRGSVAAGLGMMLRGAELAIAEGRRVQVGLPPGSPALKRMSETRLRRPLEQALGEQLGGPVHIDVVAIETSVSDPAQLRLTPERAR